ncbi:MAG: Coenzyme F420 hydrogenase/dehydrogenase, beta subunit C-terminal domain [Oscillospiraceae bacterium]|jgi:coenzyme F420-reducing hydrogenase beta subunit|nr:Coenzyme F420 hydrogenase/dehydrogenase, beta subunit C-terminal domain [Oscillospiraceae bacterium]
MSKYMTQAYACYNTNKIIRQKSTSGGIFYLLAKYVIEQRNGWVCGAVFNSEFEVKHMVTNDLDTVEQMMGSKYPQSDLKNCFVEIQQHLKKYHTVLFTGTPCQVYGLKVFLRDEHVNLITLDFVCHGVASPKIWREYLQLFLKDKPVSITFKDKIKGWKKWHIKYELTEKTVYRYGIYDIYMRSYLSGINHRPSCYQCIFKGIERVSDFTVADCWGAGEEDKELNDDKGLSALLLHSLEGKEIFRAINKDMVFKEYAPDTLMKTNWACVRSIERPKDRDKFFKVYNRITTKEKKKILKKIFGLNFKKKISYMKKRFLREVL